MNAFQEMAALNESMLLQLTWHGLYGIASTPSFIQINQDALMGVLVDDFVFLYFLELFYLWILPLLFRIVLLVDFVSTNVLCTSMGEHT